MGTEQENWITAIKIQMAFNRWLFEKHLYAKILWVQFLQVIY